MISFNELYNAHADDVYRFSHWLSGDRQEAEDITSETFIRAWAHHKKIRTETLKAFIFTIARNIYLQHLRKKKGQAVLLDVHPDPSVGPDEQTESNHKLEKVQKAVQSFSEVDRTAFYLRVHQDMPYSEIGRILNITQSAGKVKVYRIRKRLIAEFLEKEGN